MKVTQTPAGTLADRARRPGEQHHAAGIARHSAGQQPADQPWTRTSDRNVWRACKSGLVLTVTHLVTGGWQADIQGRGITRRSPVLGSRGAAQAWADDRAQGVMTAIPPGRGAARQLIIVPAPDLRDVAVSQRRPAGRAGEDPNQRDAVPARPHRRLPRQDRARPQPDRLQAGNDGVTAPGRSDAGRRPMPA